MNRSSGILGSLAAFSAVILGALGAHALKDRLAAAGTQDVWQTAVNYHMWHALALVLCALLSGTGWAKRIAVSSISVGIVLFSGSLYWLALGGPSWLGPITPLGGLALMLGWAALAVEFWRSGSDA